MKKTGTLNSHLSRIIASMGHTDRLVVCDSGLPIPHTHEVVDLALTKNIPTFIDTVKVILEELEVESAVIAEEMERANPKRYAELMTLLSRAGVTKVTKLSHEEFKATMSNGCNVAFARTGEATPYANVILIGGVTFD
jgi:D-ribose pyranase